MPKTSGTYASGRSTWLNAGADRGLGAALVLYAVLTLGCSDSTSPGDSTAGAPGSGGEMGVSGAGSGGAGAAGEASGSSGAGAGLGGSLGAGTAGTNVTGGAAGSAGAAVSGACTPPTDINAPLEKLSQTGCVDALDPKQFASTIFPYEVNSPLWSDAADKRRGMIVPAGQKINVKSCTAGATSCTDAFDEGKWEFPVGTVFIKDFAFDGKLLETRLLMRTTEKWVGYSYQWDEAQTDATLVPTDRLAIQFNTGERSVAWNYPSRRDCMKCHNEEGGSSLGPETAQMNRVVNGKNQIDALKDRSWFATPPAEPYAKPYVAPYKNQLGEPPPDATIEDRARSYLNANCGYCHRPNADFNYQDLRFGVSLDKMGICNQGPRKGDVGVPTALLLSPGSPENSVLYLRMKTLTDQRMPQIGTVVVDEPGLELIGEWIRSIPSSACPAPGSAQ